MNLNRSPRSIPEFKQILSDYLEWIVLKLCEDKQEHALEDLQEYSALVLNITPEERGLPLSSRHETVLANRIRGIAYRLKKKQLLTSPTRGVFKITKKGLARLR